MHRRKYENMSVQAIHCALFVKTRLGMTRITSVGDVGGGAPCSCGRSCVPRYTVPVVKDTPLRFRKLGWKDAYNRAVIYLRNCGGVLTFKSK